MCDFLKEKFGFIGGGNMASAIASGLVKKGAIKAENILVSAKSERTFSFWKELGARTTLDNGEVISNCDIVFLAMKPQMLDDAISSIDENKLNSLPRLIISLLVGVTEAVLKEKLEALAVYGGDQAVVRAMPNTAVAIGEGITVCCSTASIESVTARDLFAFLGISEIVPESLMNALGALSGSGPAYAYLITEGLADGAVRMGVPRDMATRFAAQVLVGAGKMVQETGKHPGQLKDEVCSPGGTTITGIHALERGGVRASLMNAVEAAVNRSDELSSVSPK